MKFTPVLKKILAVVLVTIIIITSLFFFYKNLIARKITITTNFKGITLTPYAFNEEGINDFLFKADKTGDIISWSGDWFDLQKGDKSPAVFATQLCSKNNFKSVITLQFFDAGTKKVLRELNSETLVEYKRLVLEFVKSNKPDFLGLGNEINLLYDNSLQDYFTFKTFFHEIYSEIKQTSPNTKIFTAFQYEQLIGLKGGIFGGINDETKTEVSLLNDFPDADFFAFTTYPGLIFQNTGDIPKDYYSRISSYTSKPLAFNEIGWQSASISTWENSEENQDKFIGKYFSLTRDLNKLFNIYAFLYDQKVPEPFTSMGLINDKKEKKKAYNSWVTTE